MELHTTPAIPESVEQKIFKFFDENQITYTNHCHPPLFTVEEAKSVEATIPGAHCKNLFLRTKNNRFVLVVMLGKDRLNLKEFEKKIGLGKLSFASAEQLQETLQVQPGSVTPFALIHPSSKGIDVILDQEMMEFSLVNYHPLRNDRTASIRSEDLLRFLTLCGHSYSVWLLPKISG